MAVDLQALTEPPKQMGLVTMTITFKDGTEKTFTNPKGFHTDIREGFFRVDNGDNVFYGWNSDTIDRYTGEIAEVEV